MDDEEFKKIVAEAVAEVPKEFRKKLQNIQIVIQDYPTNFQLSKLRGKINGGFLLGLYEGIPQIRRGRYGVGMTLPDKITIFKIPLIYISKSQVELKENVKETVKHEIAHHFGIDESKLQEIEEGKSN